MSSVIIVKRGDLEYIKSSIEIGEIGKALDLLEEILAGREGG